MTEEIREIDAGIRGKAHTGYFVERGSSEGLESLAGIPPSEEKVHAKSESGSEERPDHDSPEFPVCHA